MSSIMCRSRFSSRSRRRTSIRALLGLARPKPCNKAIIGEAKRRQECAQEYTDARPRTPRSFITMARWRNAVGFNAVGAFDAPIFSGCRILVRNLAAILRAIRIRAPDSYRIVRELLRSARLGAPSSTLAINRIRPEYRRAFCVSAQVENTAITRITLPRSTSLQSYPSPNRT